VATGIKGAIAKGGTEMLTTLFHRALKTMSCEYILGGKTYISRRRFINKIVFAIIQLPLLMLQSLPVSAQDSIRDTAKKLVEISKQDQSPTSSFDHFDSGPTLLFLLAVIIIYALREYLLHRSIVKKLENESKEDKAKRRTESRQLALDVHREGLEKNEDSELTLKIDRLKKEGLDNRAILAKIRQDLKETPKKARRSK